MEEIKQIISKILKWLKNNAGVITIIVTGLILTWIVYSMNHIIEIENVISIERVITFNEIIGYMIVILLLVAWYIFISIKKIRFKITSKVLIFISILLIYILVSYTIESSIVFGNILENLGNPDLPNTGVKATELSVLADSEIVIGLNDVYSKLMDWVFSPLLIGITIEFFHDIFTDIKEK